jgi:hypothetical protein
MWGHHYYSLDSASSSNIAGISMNGDSSSTIPGISMKTRAKRIKESKN